MPVVQKVEQQVATAALPGARATATENADSAGVTLADAQARSGEALGGFGASMAHAGIVLTREQREVADRERERADQIATLAAGNKLAEWEHQRLYDRNTGALGINGKESFGLPEQVGDEYKTFASGVSDGLTTPKQKEQFARITLERQSELDLTLRRHVFQQMQKYEAGEVQATIENSRSAAILNATDPVRVGQELDRAVDAIRTHAPRLGLGPEEVKQQIEATRSATHVGVIEQLLAQDQSKAASVYFEEAKGQIKGEALAHIEKALEEGTLRKGAQQQADAIVRAGGSISDQREKARSIEDPKMRDAVMERVEHEAIASDRAAREEEATTLRNVYDTIDRTHDVTAIPPAVWAGMDGGQRSAARSYADRLARGVAVETDFPTYYGLMQKAAHDPEAFATENLLTYRAKVGDTELKQLTEMQNAIVKGDRAKADKDLGDFRTHEQIVNNSLAQYGIDVKAAAKDPKGQTAQAIAELRRMLDVRVASQAATTGKKPTDVDVQAHLDSLLSADVKTPGSWWGLVPFNGVNLFGTQKRLIDLTIGDVPTADRQQIEQALRRRGRPVSPTTILDLYIENKMRAVK